MNTTAPGSLLIFGVGNPLREDDGAGLEAARRLAARLAAPPETLRLVQLLTPERALDLSQARRAVIFDASIALAPGEIEWRRERAPAEDATATGSAGAPPPFSVRRADPAFSHHFEPAALLQLAVLLYGASPEVYIGSIGGESFGQREGLTPRVEAALPALIERALHALHSPAPFQA